jgi:O-antigen/teichoic acid export membrane protein
VRILSPSQYGVLSVLLGIAYVLANILDFGVSATIYSYLPPMIEARAENLYRFLKSTFFYQTLFSAIVIFLLFWTFPYLDRVFFKTEAPWWELYLTTFSVLFLLWQNYGLNSLFAAKRFLSANLYLNLSNLIKTALIFLLYYLKLINVGSIIFIFGILGPIIFFILLFFEKKHIFYKIAQAEVKKEEFRFGYTMTYFFASQFFNLGTRMDLFLLSYFRSKTEVGYYGLASKIILTLLASITSITQVLSPAFSRAKTKKEIRSLFKTGFLYLLIPAGLFFLLFLTPNQIFYLVFTPKFAQTAAITKAISLPYIIYALGNLPLLYVLYTIKKPSIILITNVIFFVIMTAGCYYLIPIKGVFGPPLAIFLALYLSVFYLSLTALLEYKNRHFG